MDNDNNYFSSQTDKMHFELLPQKGDCMVLAVFYKYIILKKKKIRM